jgi:condensin complex subunit 1
VLEVITFFVTCYEHGLVDMLSGIRKMLALISHSEKPVKDAVISAYKRLYLKPVNSSSPVSIAKNLIKLVQDVSCYEREALEELVADFTTSGELDNAVIQILWEFFANNSEQTSAQTRLNALVLLGMIVKKIPEKGRANIQVLVDYGLSITPASNVI